MGSVQNDFWDVVIVGSGFGGCAAAWRLSRAGLRTLLLERGDWARRDTGDWDPCEVLIRHRYRSRSPLLVRQLEQKDFSTFYPFLEEVVGGMSVFYGGAVLRMRETDFAAWPIRYADIEPFYSLAERELEVHGEAGADPCEPPRSAGYPYDLRTQALSLPAQRIQRAAQALGYRPFRIPLAMNFDNGLRERCLPCATCDGFPCAISAKNDATLFLRKAAHAPLEVRTGWVAERLDLDEDGRATGVHCIVAATGERAFVEGRVLLVAAGALQSPALLMRSQPDRFTGERGVGRCLMRHCNGFLSTVFPFATASQTTFHKQLCVSDFYEDLRSELGTATGIIQDMCIPPREVVHHFAPTGLKRIAAALSRYSQGLLCVAEDEPRPENRVTLSEDRDDLGLPLLRVEHRYTDEDRRRLDHLLAGARRILRRAGGIIGHVHVLDSFSHAVGTLRFGDDPRTSVLDRDCRVHGTPNLFVVDGSFMPTSAGVNPALTIVANALRVAEKIASGFPWFARAGDGP